MRLKGGKVLLEMGILSEEPELNINNETIKVILEKGLTLKIKLYDEIKN